MRTSSGTSCEPCAPGALSNPLAAIACCEAGGSPRTARRLHQPPHQLPPGARPVLCAQSPGTLRPRATRRARSQRQHDGGPGCVPPGHPPRTPGAKEHLKGLFEVCTRRGKHSANCSTLQQGHLDKWLAIGQGKQALRPVPELTAVHAKQLSTVPGRAGLTPRSRNSSLGTLSLTEG